MSHTKTNHDHMQGSNIWREGNYFVSWSLVPPLYRSGPHSLNILSWESDRFLGPLTLLCISNSDVNFSFIFYYPSGLISFFISGTPRFSSFDVKFSYISQKYCVLIGMGLECVLLCQLSLSYWLGTNQWVFTH